MRRIHLLLLLAAFGLRAVAADPFLAFSDLDSGPPTGNADTSRGQAAGVDGAIVSVWGSALGDSQGGSTVSVNGAPATTVYYWGPAAPPWSPANLSAKHGMQIVILQVPHGATAGAGQITVTVGGRVSNGVAFTVRPGAIRYVTTGGDDASGDGSWTKPWRTIPHGANALAPGDVCYVGDGVSQTAQTDYGACVNLGGNGIAGRPMAVVAYPGATVHVGSMAVQRGFGNWVSGFGNAHDWTIAKFAVVAGESAITSLEDDYRVVGNLVSAPTGSAPEGVIEGEGSHLRVLGNELTKCGAPGCSKLYHPMYISSPRASGGARLATVTDREIAWNYLHDNNANRGINIYSEQTSAGFMTDHRVHHNWIENQVGDGMLIGYYTCGDTWVYDNVVVHAGLGPEPTDGDALGSHVGIHLDAGHESYPGSTVHLVNNTVYGCGWSGAVESTAQGALMIVGSSRYALDLRDDIVVSTGQPYVVGQSDFAGTVPGPDLWFGAGAAPRWDAHAIVADPRFVAAASDDFRLATGSPAIDVGADTHGSIAIDFAAQPRLQGAAVDLGTYESGGGGGTAPNQPPTIALTAPTSGAAFIAPASLSLAATASDSDGSIAKVVFTANGTVVGTSTAAPYALAWSNVAAGSYAIAATAYDDRGAATTSAAVTVTVTASTGRGPTTSLWDASATPAHPSDADGSAVELGVKFRSDVAGAITAIRFYKGAGNGGTHVGHLWTRDGQQLGAVTFTAESATGWQQATFATPIAIAASTTYVASYHTDVGHYAGDNGAFSGRGVDRGPLHALADGVDGGDGVYRYGASAFPTASWQASNYWVDVVFAPDESIVSGQVYELVAKHSGKVLDVAGLSLADGGNVHQWTDWHGPNQQWRLDRDADGSWTVTSINSGEVLDVEGLSLVDGGNVHQWTNWNGPNQRWRFDDLGDGSFRITNVNSGKVLDVSGFSTADGANVQQWTWTGGDNQRWTLVPVAPSGNARADTVGEATMVVATAER